MEFHQSGCRVLPYFLNIVVQNDPKGLLGQFLQGVDEDFLYLTIYPATIQIYIMAKSTSPKVSAAPKENSPIKGKNTGAVGGSKLSIKEAKPNAGQPPHQQPGGDQPGPVVSPQ